MPVAPVESLDREGRGVARVGGKTVFIDGALPGESVEYVARKAKPSYELARLTRALSESAARVTPRCPHFGVCGGCAMQHLEPRAQVATKQRVLEDALWHIGKVRAESLLAPIHGPAWGYRRRARFSARFVEKKGAVLVGFRERRSTHVAEMTRCEVLPPRESALIVPLRELLGGLAVRDRVPQVELAIGEAVTVLVLRLLAPLTAADEARVRHFADTHAVQLWLQPGGPDTARPFHPLDAPPLFYTLPEFGIQIHFLPTDFTQVNYETNAMLVRSAMRLLAPRPGERVLDLFSGLGNFALPMARSGAEVIGLEGNAGLVARARENALHNGLAARFDLADLFQREVAAALPRADAMLVDPPREGAIEIVKGLGDDAPARILYVSCDPATLARDAGVLAHVKGYRLTAAGVVNMFPHTGHVESIALFQRD
ncbi:MAG TPA: 23S rRNA (uracil(1939)-C(5))-methyltransferase RlmD [Burkholderiales bacterium]|nr:23S rRNA (uracil(1939)-C(5))-methyltransferase RlmD [Burkholderiales bacterium]